MLSSQHHDPAVRQIYEMRYVAYLGNNSINPNADGQFSDRYDTAENCTSHMQYLDRQPAGSIRACVYNPLRPDLPIPAMENFGQELAENVGLDRTIVEANKYIIHPEFQNKGIRIKVMLYGFILNVALREGADFIVGAIRPSQALFYRRMGFKPLSEVKPSLHMKFDTVLMGGTVYDAERCYNANVRRCN